MQIRLLGSYCWGWLLAGLLALLPALSLAQQPGGRLLTTADGLASNTVQSIAQDRQGFLWVGTQDGLSRYDGSSFRSFRADARRLGSLPSNFVRVLAPDSRRGGLWVGTGTGLCYYDPRTERFTSIRADSGKTYFVNALLLDAAGCVWLGTEEGLWRYDPALKSLARFHPALVAGGPSTGRPDAVRALARDAAGILWAGAADGQLYCFDPTTHQLRPAPRYHPPGPAPIGALAATPGGLWVGTEGGSLRYLPPSGPAVELVPPGGPAVRRLWADPHGGMWVATAGGLCQWPATPHAVTTPPPMQLTGEVLTLGSDRAGQLWVGTEAGLRWLDIRPSPFARLPAGATPGPVWAVASTPGTLWLGTEYMGVLGLDPRTGTVTERLRHQAADPASLADDYVRAVLPDPDGGLWVGMQHQGLDYRLAGSKGFRHFRHDVARPTSLPDDFVRCLYRDPLNGALWVGTEGGLSRLDDVAGGVFTTYRPQASQPHSLPNRYVRCALRDRVGRLWVGTGGGGLCRLDDARTGHFTTFQADAHNPHSLPSNFVRTLALDSSDRLWVGTEGGGLCRLDEARTGRFTTFGEAQGFPNDVVYGLLADSATCTLWASTNRGLVRLDPITGQFMTFDARDGVPQPEYNAGAACTGPGGHLYFGGPKGLVGFQAGAIRLPQPPPLLLTGLRRLNQPVALPDTAIGQRRELRLTPDDYVFTLEFTALDLRRAGRDPLLYRLEGFDPGWLAAGARREATYTNLDPGRYTFRVRAVGTPAGSGAVLRLVVAPPWYGTWWFRALAVGVVGLAGWLAYRLRVRQLLALEGVRHRIARDLHDDMGSTLSSISILSALARQHQLGQRPVQAAELLDQIGNSSRRMLDAMDDIVWAINPAHDGLADVTARMRALASELLEAQQIKLVFEADPAVMALRLPMASRRDFFLFYKEALNNLVKYAHCRQARVALTYGSGHLVLLIADDGVGFDPAAAPQGGGHGLPNLRVRAATLHGKFTLDTVPGRGTTVQLRLPL